MKGITEKSFKLCLEEKCFCEYLVSRKNSNLENSLKEDIDSVNGKDVLRIYVFWIVLFSLFAIFYLNFENIKNWSLRDLSSTAYNENEVYILLKEDKQKED